MTTCRLPSAVSRAKNTRASELAASGALPARHWPIRSLTSVRKSQVSKARLIFVATALFAPPLAPRRLAARRLRGLSQALDHPPRRALSDVQLLGDLLER